MRIASLAILTLALAACGSRVESAAEQNEAQRIGGDIERSAQAIARQAENGAATIERALENESAAVFDNRADLLNEAAAPAASANTQRR